jgi:D-serine deaminase-like pyridoxal phosphate-dependent protein
VTNWFEIANAAEVSSPSLLVYPDRIEENLRRMIAMVRGDVKRLRPHVKTHKLAPIIAMKRAAGITKFKCATIAECEMVATAGGEDVLLSYPLVGANITRFLELQRRFPQACFRALADDAETIEAVDQTARAAGASVELLLDVNPGMNRTGIAPGARALELYRLLASSKNVRPGGLQLYDGHHQHADRAARRAAWDAALAPGWKLRDDIQKAGLPIPRVVAGGTPTFPFFAEVPGVECSPGTTVLWDFGQSVQTPDLDFLHAAVLFTRVVSKPAPNRLCFDLGHKAVASEMPHPRVKLFGLEEATFTTHSEEHLVAETSRAAEFAVGTALYGLPRHVCPTVALHSEVFVVRQGRVTESWPVTARARKITV